MYRLPSTPDIAFAAKSLICYAAWTVRPAACAAGKKALDLQTRDLTFRLQRLPTDEELSESLGTEIAKVRHNRQMLALASHDFESPKRVDEDYPLRTRESVATPDWMPDVIHERKESFEWLLRSIDKLPARARRVVLLYYRQNLTMKQNRLAASGQ